ncbi:FAD-binding protein [Xanthobacter sp. AM11]|uniref:FAD-binding protein n=1 Tax=Xanthobacter sp. AM11 TaxID=3380643 RepID=UPI0039BFD779
MTSMAIDATEQPAAPSVMIDLLRREGIPFEEGVDLTVFTYMKTGGVAHLVIYPNTTEHLRLAINALRAQKLRFKVVGNTSNLLFLDNTDYSILVCTVRLTNLLYSKEKGLLIADCGVTIPDLARRALLECVDGFEGFEGIPGTLGGGIFMNAGAYGYELKDLLVKADIIDRDGQMRTVDAKELGLAHRTSIMRSAPNDWIVATLYFRATKGDPAVIYSKMELFHAKRHKYTEYMYPNLGSIFSGSPYRAMSRKDVVFRIYAALYYFFGYKLKIFRRESPINRKWLNDIAVARFNIRYDLQPFSDKTINCLVNRGQGTDEMVRFIRELDQLSDGRIPLENEIVDGF